MNKPQIIILAGPKHSGKSSTGKFLAEILDLSFFDTDTVLEKETGKMPKELYKEGPEILRQAEAKALSWILEQNNCVIASGGGLIDNKKAMELITKSPGIILVYLEISAETAWKRILAASAATGLPAFLDTANPMETNRIIHTRRAEQYKSAAHLTIQAENKSPEDLAGEIAGKIKILAANHQPQRCPEACRTRSQPDL